VYFAYSWSTGLKLAPPLNPNLPLAKGEVPTTLNVNQLNTENFRLHSISIELEPYQRVLVNLTAVGWFRE
jgi:hypothetical protein